MAYAGITVIARSTGRVFLMLRSGYVNDPFTWSCPAGAIDWGEDPEAAAVRELKEEAGYRGRVRLLTMVEDPELPFYHFIGSVAREFKARMNWENDDWGWFALDELPEPLHPGWEDILPLLQDMLG